MTKFTTNKKKKRLRASPQPWKEVQSLHLGGMQLLMATFSTPLCHTFNSSVISIPIHWWLWYCAQVSHPFPWFTLSDQRFKVLSKMPMKFYHLSCFTQQAPTRSFLQLHGDLQPLTLTCFLSLCQFSLLILTPARHKGPWLVPKLPLSSASVSKHLLWLPLQMNLTAFSWLHLDYWVPMEEITQVGSLVPLETHGHHPQLYREFY